VREKFIELMREWDKSEDVEDAYYTETVLEGVLKEAREQ
jgi:hypothetical protein